LIFNIYYALTAISLILQTSFNLTKLGFSLGIKLAL